MKQDIKIINNSDPDGNPTGGIAEGVGINITWQNGPLGRDSDRKIPNGAFVEDVIGIAIERLRFYQQSKFSCRENSLALTKLEEAVMWLNKRSSNREERKVEGTYVV